MYGFRGRSDPRPKYLRVNGRSTLSRASVLFLVLSAAVQAAHAHSVRFPIKHSRTLNIVSALGRHVSAGQSPGANRPNQGPALGYIM